MPSNKSTTEKVREERDLARKKLPPVRYDMSLLRKAIKSQAKTSVNGTKEPIQSFFDSETDDGGDGK